MQNCQDNQNLDVFMNVNHVGPTKDASVGTESGGSLAGRPPPQPITTRCAGEAGEWTSVLGRWHSGV